MSKKKNKFINKPHIDGGKEYLKKYIKENLKYPKQALENKIEGNVLVKYSVTAKGEVFDVIVEHGIGYGCDEEAMRLVKNLPHKAVKNRGIRLTVGRRIKIPFKLPKKSATKLNFVYSTKPSKSEDKPKKQTSENTYTYSIKIKRD